MAAGTVQLYDTAYETLFQDATRQWDDSTSGSIYWVLATSSYTPSDAHTTTTDVTNKVGGDGAPIAATDLVITDTPGTANETYFQAGAGGTPGVVSFGTNVTITAQYLIAVQPTSAGSYSGTTDKLIFYVAIDTGGDVSSTNGEFTINMPTSGWFKISQA